MPTLLQLNCASNWGSTGKIAEQIGLCAKTHGWECYVAFGRSANPSALMKENFAKRMQFVTN